MGTAATTCSWSKTSKAMVGVIQQQPTGVNAYMLDEVP